MRIMTENEINFVAGASLAKDLGNALGSFVASVVNTFNDPATASVSTQEGSCVTTGSSWSFF